jgi:predicted nucleic acid-binding protein
MNAITDTGFLVAMIQNNDEHHRWAVELASQLSWPVLTCEAVLAEAAFHLRSSELVLGMLRDRVVRVAFDCASQLDHLLDLARRYTDRRPDLADLCLVRMSELYPRHTVLTTDEADFRIYRRNKRDVIPMICPPKK